MSFPERIRTSIFNVIAAVGFVAAVPPHALADSAVLEISGLISSSSVNGANVGAGSYTSSQLEAAGSAAGTVTAGGMTGIPLWSLLGGNSSGGSDVLTSTPAGDNGKNAILHTYVLATSITGAQSILSLGEIDPFFGGTGGTPDFVSFSAADGKPQLIFPGPGMSGRNVMDLASLQVLAAPALPHAAGGVSNNFSLSGEVAHPGTYTLSTLESMPAITATVSGDTYTAVSLWNLLGANGRNLLTSYVLAAGTDGYEVVYSLAELDPAFGAPQDLVPYADTKGQFPGDGFVRIVIPGDNHQGRWVSNVDAIEVADAVPEPATAILLLAGLVVVYLRTRGRGATPSQMRRLRS